MSPGLRRLHVRKIQVRRTHMAKMDVLINHFKRQLNFIRFDGEHTPEDDVQLECFCNLSAGIEPNDNGNRLKTFLLLVASWRVPFSTCLCMHHLPSDVY
ncbi:hypothetical protein HPB51_029161 [Rhipicephalus microplus]|uniref:E3 ubiquitin ligase UBR4 C-terminal domain-containing protein n=1 Tax=Rhipicephalus microplus TaxID=6941 RepID=A0A9J6CVF3_RHIMP|nr:hypothetical protein HPB51_029161 [Rhipicephalus microplus]